MARATRVMAVVDRYRGDAEAATGDIYDGRLFREEVFVPLLAAAGGALGAGERPDRPLPTGWAIADPDGKLASAVAKRLGAPLVSAPVQTALGDTGAAAGLLGAVQRLGRSRGAGRPRCDRLRRRPGHRRDRPAVAARARGRGGRGRPGPAAVASPTSTPSGPGASSDP